MENRKIENFEISTFSNFRIFKISKKIISKPNFGPTETLIISLYFSFFNCPRRSLEGLSRCRVVLLTRSGTPWPPERLEDLNNSDSYVIGLPLQQPVISHALTQEGDERFLSEFFKRLVRGHYFSYL